LFLDWQLPAHIRNFHCIKWSPVYIPISHFPWHFTSQWLYYDTKYRNAVCYWCFFYIIQPLSSILWHPSCPCNTSKLVYMQSDGTLLAIQNLKPSLWNCYVFFQNYLSFKVNMHPCFSEPEKTSTHPFSCVCQGWWLYQIFFKYGSWWRFVFVFVIPEYMKYQASTWMYIIRVGSFLHRCY